MADPSDDEILGDLFSDNEETTQGKKYRKPEASSRKYAGSSKGEVEGLSYGTAPRYIEPAYSNEPPESRFKVDERKERPRVKSGLGEDYSAADVAKREEAQYSGKFYEGIPTTDETMLQAAERETARANREAEWAAAKKFGWETPAEADIRRAKEGDFTKIERYGGETAPDATVRRIKQSLSDPNTFNPFNAAQSAGGYIDENKLRLQASKYATQYGVSPKDWEKAKKSGDFSKIAQVVNAAKSREATIARTKAMDELTRAQAAATRAQASQRYAKAEQIETAARPGGKLVQFGAKNFGQTPIYVNGHGSHGAIRERFLPAKGSGVSSSIANTRLVLAKMHQNVLGGRTGAGVHLPSLASNVQVLQPRTTSPTVRTISKLSSFSQPKPGSTILQKLSFKKRRD